MEASLRAASDKAAVLAAAYDVFEGMLTVLWQHQDRAGDMFAPFVMAAASAADGRDAVAAAPSLPKLGPYAQASAGDSCPDTGADEVADGLATLSRLLAARLAQVGRDAPRAGDRVACAEAIRAAEKIHTLLRGTGQ
jgi:hypothetical protein